MLGLAAAPAALQFLGMLFLPESPRWLIKHGRDLEARQIMARIFDGKSARGRENAKAEVS